MNAAMLAWEEYGYQGHKLLRNESLITPGDKLDTPAEVIAKGKENLRQLLEKGDSKDHLQPWDQMHQQELY